MSEIRIRIEDFDRSQLPEGQANLSGAALRAAMQAHFENQLKASPGASEIVMTQDEVVIRWSGNETARTITEQGIDALAEGNYPKGMQLLQLALARDPQDVDALYNLGMALGNTDKAAESVAVLERLLQLETRQSRGWVALAVAKGSLKDGAGALAALQKAVEIDPGDPYALRNLGSLLLAESQDLAAAETYLTQAVGQMPEDPQAWLNLARLYEKTGELSKADEAYQKVLQLSPHGGMGELAEQGRTRISEHNFRSKGDVRPDALSYCVDGLQKFQGLDTEEVRRITYEIAMLGMNGLDVNSPEQKYTIKSLPGNYSGLHLLCIEYVGFKIVDPSVDLGFDLSKEYAAALDAV